MIEEVWEPLHEELEITFPYVQLTLQTKIFMVHVLLVVEARPFLPYCAYFLTNVGDNLVYD